MDNESLNWWRGITVMQRITLKELFPLICGVGWQEVGFIIDLRTRIDLLYNKLLTII